MVNGQWSMVICHLDQTCNRERAGNGTHSDENSRSQTPAASESESACAGSDRQADGGNGARGAFVSCRPRSGAASSNYRGGEEGFPFEGSFHIGFLRRSACRGVCVGRRFGNFRSDGGGFFPGRSLMDRSNTETHAVAGAAQGFRLRSLSGV